MKKIICIVLAVSICVMFTSCTESQKNDDTTHVDGAAITQTKANRDYFLWSDVDATVIVGLSDSGSKQTEIIIPADCTLIDTAFENTVVK